MYLSLYHTFTTQSAWLSKTHTHTCTERRLRSSRWWPYSFFPRLTLTIHYRQKTKPIPHPPPCNTYTHIHTRTHMMSNNFAISPATVPKSCVPLSQCWYSLLPDGPSSALTQSVDISDSVPMTQISPPSLQQPTTGIRSIWRFPLPPFPSNPTVFLSLFLPLSLSGFFWQLPHK